MKKSITSILALLALCAAPAMAVPSGINYQGALTDDQGNPITGTRTMSIKLYDAATAGTLLYSESIGTVDVSDGVFSFEFGTSGTSNAEQTDTVALTDGTATTFQKVLSAAEAVAGSVSVTDGTYNWSQSSGSSNENDFGVSYSTSLRRVTVTYYNGAPAAGRTITATYRSPASGISGALAGDNQPWAEITVDGVAQVPRQKVLSVPFAVISGKARSLEPATETLTLPFQSFGRSAGYAGVVLTNFFMPSFVRKIEGGKMKYEISRTGAFWGSTGDGARISFTINKVDPSAGTSTPIYSHQDQIINPQTGTFVRTNYIPRLILDTASSYYTVSVSIENFGSAPSSPPGNYANFWSMSIDHTRE
jgi:hypothetical protein